MNVDIKINDKLVKDAVERGMEAGLTEIALRVHATSTQIVPVDTGRLKNSLTWRVEGPEAEVGTNVEYAERIEYGGSRQAPQGFLRPALDSVGPKMGDIMQKNVKRAIT